MHHPIDRIAAEQIPHSQLGSIYCKTLKKSQDSLHAIFTTRLIWQWVFYYYKTWTSPVYLYIPGADNTKHLSTCTYLVGILITPIYLYIPGDVTNNTCLPVHTRCW